MTPFEAPLTGNIFNAELLAYVNQHLPHINILTFILQAIPVLSQASYGSLKAEKWQNLFTIQLSLDLAPWELGGCFPLKDSWDRSLKPVIRIRYVGVLPFYLIFLIHSDCIQLHRTIGDDLPYHLFVFCQPPSSVGIKRTTLLPFLADFSSFGEWASTIGPQTKLLFTLTRPLP